MPRTDIGTLLRLPAVDGAKALLALAALGGWALVTAGISHLTISRSVWPISTGVLLLSLCGWKLLYLIARDGLYALSREVPSRG